MTLTFIITLCFGTRNKKDGYFFLSGFFGFLSYKHRFLVSIRYPVPPRNRFVAAVQADTNDGFLILFSTIKVTKCPSGILEKKIRKRMRVLHIKPLKLFTFTQWRFHRRTHLKMLWRKSSVWARQPTPNYQPPVDVQQKNIVNFVVQYIFRSKSMAYRSLNLCDLTLFFITMPSVGPVVIYLYIFTIAYRYFWDEDPT